MRPKVVLWVLLLGFGFLGVVALVRKASQDQPKPSEPDAVAEGVSQPGTAPNDQKSLKKSALLNQAQSNQSESNSSGIINAPQAATNPAGPVFSKQYIAQRKAEFNDLSMKDDQDSLNTLLSEMQNPNKELRSAALSAVVQFDDRSSIPSLQELANQAVDMEEKIEILQAIEFIKLPSLTEFLAEQNAHGGTGISALEKIHFKNLKENERGKNPKQR